MCACVHGHVYVHVCVCVCVCVCLYVYVSVSACLCVCAQTYISLCAQCSVCLGTAVLNMRFCIRTHTHAHRVAYAHVCTNVVIYGVFCPEKSFCFSLSNSLALSLSLFSTPTPTNPPPPPLCLPHTSPSLPPPFRVRTRALSLAGVCVLSFYLSLSGGRDGCGREAECNR